MKDSMFGFLCILICTIILGIPTTVGVLYTGVDTAYIALGYLAGAVLGLGIFTGVYGMGRISESQDAEREAYAQQRVDEARKNWEQAQSNSDNQSRSEQ